MLRKKMIRKCTAVIITGALTIATAATVMATPQGNGGNGPGGGNGGPIQGVGQRFQMQQGPGDGERPEPPEGEMPQFGADERPELSVGGKPQFEAGERPELSESETPQIEEEEKPEHPRDMKGIDTDKIKTVIEELEDDDVKSGLEELLSEYEEARSALETAMENKDDDLESYRTAEMDAMKALLEALEKAGIDTRPELPEGEAGNKSESGDKEDQEERQIIRQEKDNGHQSGQMIQNRNLEQHVQENNMTSSDDSVEGAFAKIINWFKSFLS